MARLCASGLLALLSLLRPARADESRETFFELKIRPVLATTCLPCHGGKKTESGLKVDSRESLLRGGDRGPAIVAGEPEQSLLVQAIRQTHEDVKMPPKRRLSGEAVADFVSWIAAGAVWPADKNQAASQQTGPAVRHWAFQRVKVALPPVDPSGWSERPIDRFVAARRRAAGLRPVRTADRRTLIRRITFDLTGLPPTPADVANFVHDDSPDAYVRVVERLLASPRYGERWGRHWMDVVRYADTAGDNADYPVPEAARYRDYIIDSFNRDKPYDQFVREHLAGDVLAGRGAGGHYAESVIATGFLALSRRYATGPYELWHLTLEDAIDATGRTFLGLTLRCARCHDHKFDPVSQRDYYALYGIFASTTFPYAGSEELQSKKFPRMNFVPLVEPVRAEPKLKSYQGRLAELERASKSIESKNDAESRRRLGELRTEWTRLARASLPSDLPGSYAVTEGKPVVAALQRRGEPENPGPIVPRGVPRFAFLDGEPPPPVAAQSSGRIELAQWLTQAGHPLTARVMVNRIWQHHFGRGIVATPSNFGLRGEPPSHPDLLDWLAAKLVSSGWSIKAIHREIVLSQTYRLASDFDAASAVIDPENRWLWRFPRRRLEAESIRDSMLAVSGELDQGRPGPHPFPPIEAWHWTQHDPFKAVYPTNHRSVYLMTQRLVKHPFLAIFDGPDTNVSTDVRARSTVPLQALYLRNNPFVQQQAAGFARRLLAGSTQPSQRIERAFETAWGRPPDADELARASRFLDATRGALAAAGLAEDSREPETWASLAKVLMTANEFLYVD
ncbi:MAG: PSD1 and planctomycete cytochrome C domain-containing protein [Isosphaerales bacterium]